MPRGNQGSSRRGFAAMDPDEQREIASMGGRASHGGRGANYRSNDDEGWEEEQGSSSRMRSRNDYDDEDDNRSSRGGGSSRRGFAAMDPDRQREIAAEGGRASHGGRGSNYQSDDDDYQ